MAGSVGAAFLATVGVMRTLVSRGLNPASYFSLNFYEPINKLLPKYGARMRPPNCAMTARMASTCEPSPT